MPKEKMTDYQRYEAEVICMMFDNGDSGPDIAKQLKIPYGYVDGIINKYLKDKYPKLVEFNSK